jgi:hypothetical protein
VDPGEKKGRNAVHQVHDPGRSGLLEHVKDGKAAQAENIPDIDEIRAKPTEMMQNRCSVGVLGC